MQKKNELPCYEDSCRRLCGSWQCTRPCVHRVKADRSGRTDRPCTAGRERSPGHYWQKFPKIKTVHEMQCRSTRHEQHLKWLRLNKIVTYLTHWAPHPTMVLGLGKKPARQRQTAAPLPPTEHEVLGPQGVGWQGSPWGRARAHPTSKLTASSLICNLMNAFYNQQLKLILNLSYGLEDWSIRNGSLYFYYIINFCQGFLWFKLQNYFWYLNLNTLSCMFNKINYMMCLI